ncbi:glycosyltransferase family 2 protein [Alloprevotella rava]|uniref:glycosyltransferase family 2 protein n=1 Tax=Alloprevotella rava TaxID=671218 RepID=UPI0018DB3A39|nr:glycosyltransferase family 2 protein [Alloprevotella rava]
MRIAVVILNWNGAAMMQKFLPSVIKNSEEAEVIVADNGSTDDSVEMLKQKFPSVRLILLDKNYGFAEGYDKALEQVEAEYYLLLNSDVEVTPHWLQPLLNYMDKYPEVAACQPKLLAERERDSFEYAGASGGFVDKYGYPFCRGRVFADVEKDCGQYDDIAPIFWATGAALMVRSVDWHEVGGLDARFFAHMEEIDFCWRLRSRGRGLVCVPTSVVYHVGGGTLNAGHPRKTFLNFRNNLLMLYKNLPEAELKPVMRIRAILDYVAAAKMLLTDGWKHAKAVYDARCEFHRLKPDFQLSRQENLAKAIQAERNTNPIPERISQSLLWLYYAKGKKKFSDIFPKARS